MEGYIGEVKLFTGIFAPKNWALCDGAGYPVADYNAAYAIMGNQYGGDTQHFNVPNLPDLSATTGTLRYIVCLRGIFPSRP